MTSSAREPGRTAVHRRHLSGTTEPTGEERAAAAALLHMIWGLHISRAVYLAADLGIADLLAAGPRTAAELAGATQADEAALYRVLRLLAALGVLTEPQPRSFGLTIVGDRLRSDVPASMRNWAMLADTVGFGAHEPILGAVRTGKTGTEIAYGMTAMEQVRGDARRAARFDAAMSERTAAFAPSVAAAYDFAGMHVIADIGGGQGTLLAEILRRHQHLHGILFDVADNVATITLNRPESLNSFNNDMAADMQWAWETVRDTDDIQAVLDHQSVGKPVAARIVRGGQVIELSITVGERPRRED